MLNDPRSHGLWEKTAPAAPSTPPLQGSVDADVVIVGGGICHAKDPVAAARTIHRLLPK